MPASLLSGDEPRLLYWSLFAMFNLRLRSDFPPVGYVAALTIRPRCSVQPPTYSSPSTLSGLCFRSTVGRSVNKESMVVHPRLADNGAHAKVERALVLLSPAIELTIISWRSGTESRTPTGHVSTQGAAGSIMSASAVAADVLSRLISRKQAHGIRIRVPHSTPSGSPNAARGYAPRRSEMPGMVAKFTHARIRHREST
jgi:hypothetical protein